MEYLYSALTLHSAGKDVTEDGISSILEAAGIEVDSARVKALVAALDEVDIDEALESAVMAAPSAAPAAAEGASAEGGASGTEAAEEEEEEEEEEGEVVDEDEEGLGSLFG